MSFDYMTDEEENEIIKQSKDMVNSPSHYQSEDGIECIEAIKAAVGRDGFIAHCRATAIKYLWRTGKKDPLKEAEDLRKAAWYINKAAEELEQ